MPMPAAMSSFNLFTSLYALNSPSAGPVYSAGKEGRTKKMQKKGGERREERGGRRAEGGGRKDEGGESADGGYSLVAGLKHCMQSEGVGLYKALGWRGTGESWEWSSDEHAAKGHSLVLT